MIIYYAMLCISQNKKSIVSCQELIQALLIDYIII